MTERIVFERVFVADGRLALPNVICRGDGNKSVFHYGRIEAGELSLQIDPYAQGDVNKKIAKLVTDLPLLYRVILEPIE